MKTIPGEAGAGPGTVVGVNVALTGVLKDQSDIAVYGMVEGEVISDNLVTIGQTAQVKGPVRGRIITIAGVVRGSITANEKLEILETGKVFGAIDAKDLVVHSGASLSGKVTMEIEEESVEPEVAKEKPDLAAEPAEEKTDQPVVEKESEEAESKDLLLPDDE